MEMESEILALTYDELGLVGIAMMALLIIVWLGVRNQQARERTNQLDNQNQRMMIDIIGKQTNISENQQRTLNEINEVQKLMSSQLRAESQLTQSTNDLTKDLATHLKLHDDKLIKLHVEHVQKLNEVGEQVKSHTAEQIRMVIATLSEIKKALESRQTNQEAMKADTTRIIDLINALTETISKQNLAIKE